MLYGVKFGFRSFLFALIGLILEFTAYFVEGTSSLGYFMFMVGGASIILSLIYCTISFIRGERGKWKYSGLGLMLIVVLLIWLMPVIMKFYHFN
ncbi:hypothetical protein D9X91_08150 [Falsibacillus albus]|uniref:Uncharacterized protein n=1 Tax=Falsibacillus albus TaxID=2478915 RepID=A0A3L7JZE2_9BACI|nr:hypothetical protein D9X91_08150 [Falsibacillus albus]